MIEVGTVDAVRSEILGSFLIADAADAATEITVDDLADFSEDGGWLIVNDQVISYTTADDDTGIIELDTPLDNAAVEGDRVDVYTNGSRASVLWADVYIGDADETVEVMVPISIRDRLREGSLDSEQSVHLDVSGDTFTLVDVVGAEPLLDPTYLDPEIPIPDENQSDGVPPDTSPIPTVTGLARLLLAKIEPVLNHDAVTYEWHITTDSGDTPTVGGATKHHEDSSTFTSIDTLGDGTPLVYETDYYIGTFAYDVDGAAAFSGWSEPVQMDPNGTADIAVGAITAANIEAVLILSSLIKTADAGQRLELDNDGLRVFDSDGNALVDFPTTGDDLTLEAALRTRDIIVQGGLDLRGENVGAKQSSLQMQAKVANPLSTPVVTAHWPAQALVVDGFRPVGDRNGLAFHNDVWWVAHEFFGAGFVTAYNQDGTLFGGLGAVMTLPTDYQPRGGLCHMTISGNERIIVLCKDEGAAGDPPYKVVLYDDAGNYQSEWDASGFLSVRNAHIGTDGTNLLIAQQDTAGVYKVYIRNPTTGASAGSTITCDSGTTTNMQIRGLYYGAADFGATRIVIQADDVDGFDAAHMVFNTSGVLQSTSQFLVGAKENGAGVVYADPDGDGNSSFYSLSRQSANIYQHSDLTPTTYWLTYTWYDADSTGGTHETEMASPIGKAALRRQCLTITTPPIPDQGGTDDADSVRIYAGTSSTRTSQWRQSTPAAGVRTYTISKLVTSGSNPPSSSDFPGVAAFAITNLNDDPVLSGEDLPWTSYTPVVTGGTSNPTTSNSTLIGRYMVRQKKVEFEIHLTVGLSWAASPGSGVYSVTLPPVTPARSHLGFMGTLLDLNTLDVYTLHAMNKDSIGVLRLHRFPGTAGAAMQIFGATNPITIAQGDVVTVTGTYEAA